MQKYPLRNDYETAVRNLSKFVYDPLLQQGKAAMQSRNRNLLKSYNGGKAIVYEIETPNKKYALKCWVEDLGDLRTRYKEIDAYLKQVNLPFFVDFTYHEEGILVNGRKFPIVTMEWVNGSDLKKFIRDSINIPYKLTKLADHFLYMVSCLHKNQISHGDLQHGNLMIGKNGETFLVDYDCLFVPKLDKEIDNIKGLPGYQHPHRKKIVNLSPKADYFSEMVIYLSLLALAEKSSYWQNIEHEERLIFAESDFENTSNSNIFRSLKTLSPKVQYLTNVLEDFCRESVIENLRPLEDVVSQFTGESVEAPSNMSADAWGRFQSSEPTPDGDFNRNVPSSEPEVNPWLILDNKRNISSDPWLKLESSSKAWEKFETDKADSPKWDVLPDVDKVSSAPQYDKKVEETRPSRVIVKKTKPRLEVRENKPEVPPAPQLNIIRANLEPTEYGFFSSPKRYVFDIWRKFLAKVNDIWSKFTDWADRK